MKIKWICYKCSVPCKYIENCKSEDFKKMVADFPKFCPHTKINAEWELVKK